MGNAVTHRYKPYMGKGTQLLRYRAQRQHYHIGRFKIGMKNT